MFYASLTHPLTPPLQDVQRALADAKARTGTASLLDAQAEDGLRPHVLVCLGLSALEERTEEAREPEKRSYSATGTPQLTSASLGIGQRVTISASHSGRSYDKAVVTQRNSTATRPATSAIPSASALSACLLQVCGLRSEGVRDVSSRAVCAAGIAFNRVRGILAAKQRARGPVSVSPARRRNSDSRARSSSRNSKSSLLYYGPRDPQAASHLVSYALDHGHETARSVDAPRSRSGFSPVFKGGATGTTHVPGVRTLPLAYTHQPLSFLSSKLEGVGAQLCTSVTALEHMTLVFRLTPACLSSLLQAASPASSKGSSPGVDASDLDASLQLEHWDVSNMSARHMSEGDGRRAISARRRVHSMLEAVVTQERSEDSHGRSLLDVTGVKERKGEERGTIRVSSMHTDYNNIELRHSSERVGERRFETARGRTMHTSSGHTSPPLSSPLLSSARPSTLPSYQAMVDRIFAAATEVGAEKSGSRRIGDRDSRGLRRGEGRGEERRGSSTSPGSLHSFYQEFKTPVPPRHAPPSSTSFSLHELDSIISQQILQDRSLLSSSLPSHSAPGTRAQGSTGTASRRSSDASSTYQSYLASHPRANASFTSGHGGPPLPSPHLADTSSALVQEVRKSLLRRGLSRSTMQAAGMVGQSEMGEMPAPGPRSPTAASLLAAAKEGLHVTRSATRMGYAPSAATGAGDESARQLEAEESGTFDVEIIPADRQTTSPSRSHRRTPGGGNTRPEGESGTNDGSVKGVDVPELRATGSFGPRPVVIARTLSGRTYAPSVPPPPLPPGAAALDQGSGDVSISLDAATPRTSERAAGGEERRGVEWGEVEGSTLKRLPSAQRIWLRGGDQDTGDVDTRDGERQTARGSSEDVNTPGLQAHADLHSDTHTGRDVDKYAIGSYAGGESARSHIARSRSPVPNVDMVLSPFAPADTALATLEIQVADIERRRRFRLLNAASTAGRVAGEAAASSALPSSSSSLSHSISPPRPPHPMSTVTQSDVEVSRLVAARLADAADAATAYRMHLERAIRLGPHTHTQEMHQDFDATDMMPGWSGDVSREAESATGGPVPSLSFSHLRDTHSPPLASLRGAPEGSARQASSKGAPSSRASPRPRDYGMDRVVSPAHTASPIHTSASGLQYAAYASDNDVPRSRSPPLSSRRSPAGGVREAVSPAPPLPFSAHTESFMRTLRSHDNHGNGHGQGEGRGDGEEGGMQELPSSTLHMPVASSLLSPLPSEHVITLTRAGDPVDSIPDNLLAPSSPQHWQSMLAAQEQGQGQAQTQAPKGQGTTWWVEGAPSALASPDAPLPMPMSSRSHTHLGGEEGHALTPIDSLDRMDRVDSLGHMHMDDRTDSLNRLDTHLHLHVQESEGLGAETHGRKLFVRANTAALRHFIGLYSPTSPTSFMVPRSVEGEESQVPLGFVHVVDSRDPTAVSGDFPLGMVLWALFQHYTTYGDPLKPYALSLSKFRRLVRDLGIAIDPILASIMARKGGAYPDVLDIARATKQQAMDPLLLAPARRKLCTLEAYELLFINEASHGLSTSVPDPPVSAFETTANYKAAQALRDFELPYQPGAQTQRMAQRRADASTGRQHDVMTSTRKLTLPTSTRLASSAEHSDLNVSGVERSVFGGAAEVTVNLHQQMDASRGDAREPDGGVTDVTFKFGSSAAGQRSHLDFGQFLSVMSTAVYRRFGRDSDSSWAVFSKFSLMPLAEQIGSQLLRASRSAAASMSVGKSSSHETTASRLAAVKRETVVEIAADTSVARLRAWNTQQLQQLFTIYTRQPGLGGSHGRVFVAQSAQRERAASRSRTRRALSPTPSNTGRTNADGLLDMAQLAAFAHDFGLLGVVCDLSQLQRAFTIIAVPSATSTTAATEYVDLLDFDSFILVLLTISLCSHYTCGRLDREPAACFAALLERLHVSEGRVKVGRHSRIGAAIPVKFRW